MQELGERLEAMIALVADSFPADWSLDDKRELAMRQLGMLEDVV